MFRKWRLLMGSLKVGQSFEVVESLVSEIDTTKRRHYIQNEDKDILDDAGDWFYQYSRNLKQIGKLTITKVK